MKTQKHTIENAPEPFRKELEDLKKRGILDSPRVKTALLKVMQQTRDEARKV